MNFDDVQRELNALNVNVPDDFDITTLPEVSRPDKAIRAIRFIQTFCSHTKGKWAGVKFHLLQWQFKIIWQLFGTCTPDGLRQYRVCYCEIPKKNGKSELAAAIALLLLVGDDEEGGEVYSAAADKNQAGLVYDVAAQMVRNNSVLSKRLAIRDSVKRILDYKTNSFYKVLSADVKTKHGLNPHGIIFDELHAQPNDKLWRVLTAGTDYAREQQLIFAISTAGEYDIHSVWWRVREKAKNVLSGTVHDDTFLPVLYIADRDDDPSNKDLWRRVNPSLGHIFSFDKIENDFNLSKQSTIDYIDFQRFRLNIPVNSVNTWLSMEHWDKCVDDIDIESLKGRDCFGGLDLASKIDLTCFCLLFPPIEKNEKWVVIPKFYVPEDTISTRSDRDNVRYDIWVSDGHITPTPGNVCDYAFIKRDIREAAELFNLIEVGYDPWGATSLATELDNQHGISMVETRPGMQSLSEPSKKLLELVMKHEINHLNNPVLRWCASNTVVRKDENENIRPTKEKSVEKIDGIVALIMANSRALFHNPPFSIIMPSSV